MIEEAQAKALARLDRAMTELREQFKLLTKASDLLAEYHPRQFQSLIISHNAENQRVDVSWQGINLTFTLTPGFSSESRPQARIVCVHTHSIFGKPISDVIGTFVINESGQTDFPMDERGNVPTLQGSADLVVLTYLEIAMRQVEQRAASLFAE